MLHVCNMLHEICYMCFMCVKKCYINFMCVKNCYMCYASATSMLGTLRYVSLFGIVLFGGPFYTQEMLQSLAAISDTDTIVWLMSKTDVQMYS